MGEFKYTATMPAEKSLRILDFCQTLDDKSEPVFLDLLENDWADIGMCLSNVETLLEEHEGTMQFGWSIWEQRSLFLFGECHVVALIDGKLVDPTPSIGGERRALFLPSVRASGGFPSDSRHYPLHNSKLCERICSLATKKLKMRFLSDTWQRIDDEQTRLTTMFYAEQARRRKRAKAKRPN